MKTLSIKNNGVRDSTEEKLIQNWAAKYAEKLNASERTARENADKILQDNIDNHASERATNTKYSHVKLSDSVTTSSSIATAATPAAVKKAYDKAVQGVNDAVAVQRNLNEEVTKRQIADNTLQQNINKETTARKEADNAFDERITVVEGKAHTHGNKTVLDGISASDIDAWNGIKEQVTQSQLDAVKAYFEDLCFGFANEFKSLWNAIGMTVYDGGIFGQAQTDISLDGGDFIDEIIGEFDCGGFEPYRVTTETGAVIDGGSY